MRKRILCWALACCLALSLLPAAALAAPADAREESGDLFYQYMLQLAQEEGAASLQSTGSATAGNRLTGLDRTLYDLLREEITQTANGERLNTSFSLGQGDLGLDRAYTAQDLGLEYLITPEPVLDQTDGRYYQYFHPDISKKMLDMIQAFDLNAVTEALYADLPYALYWHDKTTGVYYSSYAGWVYDDETDTVSFTDAGLVFSFDIADSYAQENTVRLGNKDYHTDFNPNSRGSVPGAVEYARQITERYSGSDVTDYSRLLGYKEEICNLVGYDHAAADNDSTPYGDPWQLISVFDQDPATNVVCEGYAKAFQFLCDLTDFQGEVQCYTVSGNMFCDGSGENHMWNMVTMPDGKTYLVDVTNCDGESDASKVSVGYPDKLFLKGAAVEKRTFYSSTGETVLLPVVCPGKVSGLMYWYDNDTVALWGHDGTWDETDILWPSGEDYVPACLVTMDFQAEELSPDNAHYGEDQLTFSVEPGFPYAWLVNPARSGYTFDGWFTKAKGGERITNDTIFNGSGDVTVYAHWTENPGVPAQLGAPGDVHWGRGGGGTHWETPGSMHFRLNVPLPADGEIRVYLQGQEEPIDTVPLDDFFDSQQMDWISVVDLDFRSVNEYFPEDELKDGATYYFTVQLWGDGTEYADSEVVRSDDWTYLKPDGRLPKLAPAAWEWPWAVFERDSDHEYTDHYDLGIFFSETEGGEETFCTSITVWPDEFPAKLELDNETVEENGAGYYSVRVRAVSKDIETIQNGPWSDPVTIYDAPGLVRRLKVALADSSVWPDDYPEIVAREDPAELWEILTRELEEDPADLSGSAWTALREMEERMADRVHVENQVEGLYEGQIIGALLNLPAPNNPDDVNLTITPSNWTAPLPEEYDQETAVRFSVDMDRPQNVPVLLDLIIPEGIDPQSAVILRESPNGGDPERAPFYAVERWGEWRARILLDRMGDFALTQPGMTAQRTEDGKVTVHVPACAEAQSGWLAAYDTQGRQVSVQPFAPAEASDLTLPGQAADQAVKVKAFYLDQDAAPVRPSGEAPVTGTP